MATKTPQRLVRKICAVVNRPVSYVLFAAFSNVPAPLLAVNVDSEYRDAVAVFERRDIASCNRAIALLEKILEKKNDHLESQALISYAYAHEAFLLSQIGEGGSDYQNSADAFSKAVLAQQPQNAFARKASLLLQLAKGNHIDVRKILERDVTDKETDADLWYMLAVVSEGDKAQKALRTALTLNADFVWVYSDLGFRALKFGDLATAEKWAQVLAARRPGIADVDLLNAVIAAHRKDKKNAMGFWTDFSRKAPDSSLAIKFAGVQR